MAKVTSKSVALSQIQRYCAFQDRCHHEVRAKLLQMGVYGDVLEEIMAELVLNRFLDEERFARSFVRGKFRFKQWGRLRIMAELQQRRISDYCIQQAFTEINEQEYLDQLQNLLQKKAQQDHLSSADFHQRQKLAAYAFRKGFESELIQDALSKLITSAT